MGTRNVYGDLLDGTSIDRPLYLSSGSKWGIEGGIFHFKFGNEVGKRSGSRG